MNHFGVERAEPTEHRLHTNSKQQAIQKEIIFKLKKNKWENQAKETNLFFFHVKQANSSQVCQVLSAQFSPIHKNTLPWMHCEEGGEMSTTKGIEGTNTLIPTSQLT